MEVFKYQFKEFLNITLQNEQLVNNHHIIGPSIKLINTIFLNEFKDFNGYFNNIIDNLDKIPIHEKQIFIDFLI